jgi:hypothetical protein
MSGRTPRVGSRRNPPFGIALCGRPTRRKWSLCSRPAASQGDCACAGWENWTLKRRCLRKAQIPLDWSPDGRFIAFMNVGLPRFANEQQSDIGLIDMSRGKTIVPLLNSRFHESWGAFSPDGKVVCIHVERDRLQRSVCAGVRSGDAPALRLFQHSSLSLLVGVCPLLCLAHSNVVLAEGVNRL